MLFLILKNRGICIEDNETYILSELLDNGSLQAYLAAVINQTRTLSWATKLNILKDVCRGMTCLHDRKPPISHR